MAGSSPKPSFPNGIMQIEQVVGISGEVSVGVMVVGVGGSISFGVKGEEGCEPTSRHMGFPF